MTEQEMRLYLLEALSEGYEDEGNVPVLISSYEEAGMLTRNEGLVIRMEDGSEFQVTIVQSR